MLITGAKYPGMQRKKSGPINYDKNDCLLAFRKFNPSLHTHA